MLPGAELQLFPSPTCECNKKEQGTVSDGACEGGDFKDENSKGTHPMLPFPIVAAIWHFSAPQPGVELQLPPTCERKKKEQVTVSDGAWEVGGFNNEIQKE